MSQLFSMELERNKQKYKLKVLSRFSLEQFFDSFPIALPAKLHSFIRFESQVQMRVASIYFISTRELSQHLLYLPIINFMYTKAIRTQFRSPRASAEQIMSENKVGETSPDTHGDSYGNCPLLSQYK